MVESIARVEWIRTEERLRRSRKHYRLRRDRETPKEAEREGIETKNVSDIE